MGSGVLIIAHRVADYRAVLSCLAQHGLHHLIFHVKSNKRIRAVIRHLSVNTSSCDITLAQQELSPFSLGGNTREEPRLLAVHHK
jgi:hypothetical protein